MLAGGILLGMALARASSPIASLIAVDVSASGSRRSRGSVLVPPNAGIELTANPLSRRPARKVAAEDQADPAAGACYDEASRRLRVKAQMLATLSHGDDLSQLVRAHASSRHVFEELALEELARGSFDRAVRIARSVLAGSGEAPNAHLVLGVVAHQRGRLAQAKAAYARYLALCPGCVYAAEVRVLAGRLRVP